MITFEEMNNQVRSFIELHKTNHLIILTSDDKVKYEFYLKIQNGILKIYEKLRNRLSQNIYFKNYEELSEIEKDEIKKVYPMNFE